MSCASSDYTSRALSLTIHNRSPRAVRIAGLVTFLILNLIGSPAAVVFVHWEKANDRNFGFYSGCTGGCSGRSYSMVVDLSGHLSVPDPANALWGVLQIADGPNPIGWAAAGGFFGSLARVSDRSSTKAQRGDRAGLCSWGRLLWRGDVGCLWAGPWPR